MCDIQITSVQGTSSTPYTVSVSGTATDCKEVSISVNCIQEQKKQVPVINGVWSANFSYGDICQCGTFIDILVTCVADPTCGASYSLPLPCGCCPAIVVSPKFDICNISGQRLVQLSTQIFISDGCTPLTVQWNFGNGQLGPVHNFTSPGTYTFTDGSLFYPGFYQAELIVINPIGCPKFVYSININPCPPVSCCPNIAQSYEEKDCNDDNEREVILSTTIDVPSGCPPVIVQTDFGDGNFGQAQTLIAGTNTFTESHMYDSNNSYIATLNVITPTNCTSSSIEIGVTDCDKPSEKGFLGILCLILRAIIVTGIGLSLLFLILYTCFADPTLLTASAISFATAAVAFAIYYFVCRDCLPCNWVLYLLWSVAFGIGLILFVYSTNATCCNNNFIIGLGLIGLSIILMIAWANSCAKTFCELITEIAFIMATYVLVIIAFIQTNFSSLLGACYNASYYNYIVYLNSLIVIIMVFCLSLRTKRL